MRKPRLQRLAVLRGRRRPDADGHAHHHRHAALAAEHVAVLGGLVHHFVDGAKGEIDHAQLNHRCAAGQRHADGGADDGAFRDRRVDDAIRAKASDQRLTVGIAVLAEHAAASQVFAQSDDVGITRHRLRQGQRGGLRVSHLNRGAHCHTPAPVFWMSV